MTIPALWSAADGAPHDFRDAASVGSLLDGVRSSEPKLRQFAAFALSRVVKALETDPVETSMQLLVRALPELMPLLMDDFLNGPIISITRRIQPDTATVAVLLKLLQTTAPEHHEMFLEALRQCTDEARSPAVEQALGAARGLPVRARS